MTFDEQPTWFYQFHHYTIELTRNRHLIIAKVHCPHNQGSQYIKCKLNLIIPIYNLTTIKLDNHYQTNQKLRTVGYFNHEHPITGIFSFYRESNFPIQSKSLMKIFCQTKMD